MSSSAGWLPAKSKVNSSSHTWEIKSFSENKFDTEIYDKSSRKSRHINGLSSDFSFQFVQDERYQNKTCRLWLTRDPIEKNESNTEQSSPWLRLSLTTSNNWLYERSVVPQNDSRHMCVAWISNKHRQRISKLIGGFNINEFAFTNPEFVLYDDLFDEDKNLLCNDTLTIVCEIHAFTNNISYVDSWLFHPMKSAVTYSSDHTLLKDLKRMLDTGQGSDVTLVASDGRELPAHVSILSSRSPVFAAMFEHDMKEKQEKRVTIDDLSSKVVAGLLEFMYSDTVSDITTLAPELLPAAHKYDISRMKTMCEEAMMSQLNTDNAAEFFLLADLHDANHLRPVAKQLAATHFYGVKKTAGWKTLQNQRPQLTEELINELAELMRQLTSE